MDVMFNQHRCHKYTFRIAISRKTDIHTNNDSPCTFPDSMLTMSLPVFHNEMFIGVIGLDLSVRHLWTEFSLGIYMYFFIVDQDHHLLYHPLLPIVVEAGEEPVALDVGLVETEADKRGVIASMKR